MTINQTLREKLAEASEEQYKKFHQSLVPGLTNMLGVRMPKVRELAKWAAKQEWQSEWETLSVDCYEELMIKGLLIGYGKLTKEEQTYYLEKFIPLIDSWGICDCCCSTWKFMKNNQEYWFDFLKFFLESEREFEARTAIVSMLDYFINEDYLERLFQAFDEVRKGRYYVDMAVAWAVSVCYAKYPCETRKYLEKDLLDEFTHNKAIQKIRESYRVSEEEKRSLLALKR